ncbi:Chitin deacetylase 2 [Hanseniaspora osmophila]|uniref:chitin deacetylase n=1 Tax=Hanseniaspora osmophila TaxID=56408 RepID=A0A1E5RAV6_9ASCO|nr:Chitin deacetylase 2 [Hanseniaspora osmophila]
MMTSLFAYTLVYLALLSLGYSAEINHSQALSAEKAQSARLVSGLQGALSVAAKTPFPKWLSDFTGLTEWPGLNPPYIPLDYIDFSKIPNYKPYTQGSCGLNPRIACSFDCDKCVEPDDVYTCTKLSQTFDDGPSDATQDLLNHLKHKTTFFNLGINVVSHPDVYKKILDKGHLIGTHTWSHPFMPSLTNEEIIAQIEWSVWAMNATGNHLPKWFRPPYGGIDNRVRAITRQFGLQAVLWDYDTFDWQMLGGGQTRKEADVYRDVAQWKSRTPAQGLVLEHDGSQKTVDVGKTVSDIIGPDQLTVAQCVNGIDYIKVFGQADNLKG